MITPSPSRPPSRLCVLALVAALAACSGHDRPPPPDPNAPTSSLIFSPNGEPLNGGPLGRPSCREATSRWFDRVDANHDGAITREEFLADARTQFTRMDIDGNGYLLPEELERFRLPYRQPQPAHPRAVDGNSDDSGGSGGLLGIFGHRSSKPAEDSGRGRADSQPDPVMSADTQMDFRVTREAYLAQATATFAKLDAGHRGRLEQSAIQALCEPKP